MSSNFKSGDRNAEQLIQWGTSYWVETCFLRCENLKPCPMGAAGACCKHCHMGPCRFIKSSEEKVEKGVCGAKLSTVSARDLLRMAAAGTASHSEQASDLVSTLRGVARGEVKDLSIADEGKLHKVAGILGVDFEDGAANDVAVSVAERLIDDFGRRNDFLGFAKRAPGGTRKRWEKWGIVPGGIDSEVAEALYRTTIGVDHDPDSILLSALRVSLAGGWGGSMISTDIADILCGTPEPVRTEAGFGVFGEDEVNLVFVGHGPVLAKMILEAASEPDMIKQAGSMGAKGIRVGSIFMMRHGIPNLGGFTNQELCMMTGLIDAIVVDEQCIMPTLAEVAGSFHTKVISTSRKATFPGALQMPYEPSRAREVAREAVRTAIENYPNRTGMGERIIGKFPMVAGFSQEYLERLKDGAPRSTLRLLNEAIFAGNVRGIACLVGCDNPRVQATGIHGYLARELVNDDVLVFTTESASAACAACGYLNPETALEEAGPGLREACESIRIPPILSLGSSSENSRILTILSAMAAEGGLSDEIGGMPVVAVSPEWVAEKDITAGCYFAASGVPAILGGTSPVKASEEVSKIMTEVWYERFGGSLHFEPDPEKMLDLALFYIDRAREELKLGKYEYGTNGRRS